MSTSITDPVSLASKSPTLPRKRLQFLGVLCQSGKRLAATISSFLVVVAGVVYTQQDRVPRFREIVIKVERIFDDGVRKIEQKTGVDIPDEEFRKQLRQRGY
jgi:hypothetical protein